MRNQTRNSIHAHDSFCWVQPLWVAGLILLIVTGCKNLVQRSQSPDNYSLPLQNANKQDKSGYVGDVCRVYGLGYAKVEGIGLAVALRDTGSNPKPGAQREYLIQELSSKKLDIDIESLLSGTDTELVLMKGLLPPGVRKGQKFDIEVGTLGTTDATSIENGMVMQTRLRPMEELDRAVKQGQVMATGKGRILVDALFESRQDQPNQMHGYILGGGVALEDRSLGLTISHENFTPKTTTMISRAINSRFTFVDKDGRQGVAEPKTNRFVDLVIPAEYLHNVGRYLNVVTNIVHSETGDERLERMELLEEQIVDPSQADLSALRLEALGNDGVPILKRVLLHPELEVKFRAAEALAYMGHADGVDHLRLVAEKEPAFRWHALKALTSLNKPAAGEALKQLLHVKSAESRYGAFTALLARLPEDPVVTGTWLGDFYLHQIPSETSAPMLHFSHQNRPEIVLFGTNQTVGDEFLHIESRMTIKATGKGTVSITRYSTDSGQERKVCSNQVGELIETLTRAGMGYGDLLKMFRTAKDRGQLSSRLVVNAVPRLGRAYVPGQSLEDEPTNDDAGPLTAEMLVEPIDHGNLSIAAEESSATSTPATAAKADTSDSKSTRLGRMKDWFTRDK